MAFATKPKPPASHKKRSGKHRTHSGQYLKHYWPYLPLLAIVMVGLLCNMLWPQGASVLGARSDLTNQSLLLRTNEERIKKDQLALVPNSQLSQAAESKALDMVAGNYWSHDTPDGKTPWAFIASSGYDYSKAGENLAYGFTDADAAITAWMHSPEHRQNILDAGYTEVGFGIASSKDYVGHGAETVVVAMYATPVTDTAPVLTTTNSSDGSAVKGASTSSQPVTRVALFGQTGTESTPVALIGITCAAALLFIIRHARMLHKSLVRGEAFVMHHPYFDGFTVAVVTVGFVLTRAAGFVL